MNYIKNIIIYYKHIDILYKLFVKLYRQIIVNQNFCPG
jgi:hypothetical protein